MLLNLSTTNNILTIELNETEKQGLDLKEEIKSLQEQFNLLK